jgi:Domain of unknown function (DUF4266)
MSRGLRIVWAAPLLLVIGGCATVKPYERGLLAKPKMQLEPSPEGTLLENHVYDYREGSAGAAGAVGGGCGCN